MVMPARTRPRPANIDLYNFGYPLSAADDARLTELLGAVLRNARRRQGELANSRHKISLGGDRAFLEQAEALAGLENGTLMMNDLSGKRRASWKHARFAAVHQAPGERGVCPLVKAESRRTGPSGVRKANYNWYLNHVLLSPDADQQTTCFKATTLSRRPLKRCETGRSFMLAKSRSGRAAATPRGRTAKLYALLVDSGFIAGRRTRAALAARTRSSSRNAFTNVTALIRCLCQPPDALIELGDFARAAPERHPRRPPLFKSSRRPLEHSLAMEGS